MEIKRKRILITGGAVRIGRALALAAARRGADILLHYGHSRAEAEQTQAEIQAIGCQATLVQADFSDPASAADLISRCREYGPLFALVNNAAIFEPLRLENTTLVDWQRHMDINLTAPFLLSQSFAAAFGPAEHGRIVNLLDWRALRPGADHLPYTISKAGLAALTRSLAVALAPRITVNGLALGAILPPSDHGETPGLLGSVPAGRWAELAEVEEAFLFLLEGPAYVTGEIIHVDGGRHLV
jgi:NAD(P)-dependent dehydrogenase (short-subunit alcohol dehydrogenase family)